MKQVLGLKFSQHLALTPQLQQSIKLLQLSTLELAEEVERVLNENPLLERLEDPMAAGRVGLSASGQLIEQRPGEAAAPQTGGQDAQSESGQSDEWSASSGSEDDNTADYVSAANNTDGTDWGRPGGGDDDDREGTQLSTRSVSLQEHLIDQLRMSKASMRDRVLVGVLIESLDENGYLTADMDEIAASAAKLLGEKLTAESFEQIHDDLKSALKLLQSFDPPGVGARDASECLALQILHSDSASPLRKLDKPVLQLALNLIKHHLPLLAARDYAKIKRLTKCDDDELRCAQAAIKLLDPHPGARFADVESNYVAPDVMAVKTKSGWKAQLNGVVMPKLGINEAYARILKDQKGRLGEGGVNLATQLQEARWLIKNIEQRFDTILRVSQAIIDRQKAFFTHGAVAMRPLVLREIADQLGLHESTISRVTTQKYMLTPFGTYELKYFFGSSLDTEAGGAASSTAVRELIKQLIAAENAQDPLSDSKIADLLGDQGVVVARRTIAKYRESLKIPPVNLRKSL
jgi:RNA polymerase sigma-54 factor